MKRTAILILLALFLGVFIVLVLHLTMEKKKDNHQYAGFDRVFVAEALIPSDTLDIKYNSYYISGGKDEQIYLGNSTAPLHLLSVNTVSKDTQHIKLTIKNSKNLKAYALKVKVDPPYFYIMDGTIPNPYRGKINKWEADHFIYKCPYYAEAVPLDSLSLAVRSLNSNTHEYVLGKVTNDNPYINFVPGLLEKQVDGRLGVDGMLHYNKELQKLVYVYYYRNQYIVMNKDLKLDYRGNTIDTISQAKIEIASITSENKITPASSPLVVNKKSSVSGKWLFVNSNLMAINEIEEEFDQMSVIDVYNLKEGNYQFSFYLPDFEKNKIKNFKVFYNQLIVLYDHYMITYDINKTYFQSSNKLNIVINK